MKQILEIIEDINMLKFDDVKEPAIIYNETCQDNQHQCMYTVTILAAPESIKLHIVKYCYDKSCTTFQNRDVVKANYMRALCDDEYIKEGLSSLFSIELSVVPVLDNNLCFYLYGYRYRLDYCQGMTHILLIFKVDDVGTPMSSDFICCESILESGKQIPREVYEYLTNEQAPKY